MSATVERTTQYLRLNLECDASEMAPVAELACGKIHTKETDGRADKRLSDQPANRASEPNQACNLLRYAKR